MGGIEWGDTQALFNNMHRAMVAEYAGYLDRDPRTVPDLKLAAQLAAGQLHGASTLYGVLRLVGEKAGKLARGKLRLTTSKLEGLGPEDMNEVAFFGIHRQ